jgi:hypothetical protein
LIEILYGPGYIICSNFFGISYALFYKEEAKPQLTAEDGLHIRRAEEKFPDWSGVNRAGDSVKRRKMAAVNALRYEFVVAHSRVVYF